ncbi:MAG: radical SAM protein [Candidatus Hydrogenedentota bacterium]|nr:MAG: radical SAM protein [Candidatus Hydrogenedentota bacterium]
MHVNLVYCDVGSPARALHLLGLGVYAQVLADGHFEVRHRVVLPERSNAALAQEFSREGKYVVVLLDEFNFVASIEFARQLRRSNFPYAIIAAGIGTVLCPDELIRSEAFDFLVIGEGEIALYELLHELEYQREFSRVKNLWWREPTGEWRRNPLRPLVENIDTLPIPDRTAIDQFPFETPVGEKVLYVAASRGCPHECVFCYSPVLKRAYGGKGTYFRCRSAASVAGEILAELRRLPYDRIIFCDELFPMEKPWLRGLVQHLQRATPPPFEVTAAAEMCDDEALRLLKEAGCAKLWIGVENGNEAFRKRIATRNHSNSKLREIVNRAHELGIQVGATVMFGVPLESEESVRETVALFNEIEFDDVRPRFFCPITGTSLAEYLRGKQQEHPIAASDTPIVDFLKPAAHVPVASHALLNNAMSRLRMHAIARAVRNIPNPPPSTVNLLHELTRARFQLANPLAVDVRTFKLANEQLGYLALQANSEIHIPWIPTGRQVLSFYVGATYRSLDLLTGTSSAIGFSVIWRTSHGDQTLLERRFTAVDAEFLRKWSEILVPFPRDAGEANLVLRVVSNSSALENFSLLLAQPLVAQEEILLSGRDAEQAIQRELAKKQQEWEAKVAALEEELRLARQKLAEVTAERDDKISRIGELHTRLLALEKLVDEQTKEIERLQTALSRSLVYRLRKLFKKS